MKILAIETSCDDTAISLVTINGSVSKPRFKILAHNVSSQIKIHQPWGGVVPSLAKREHSRNLVPLLIKSLTEAKLLKKKGKRTRDFSPALRLKIKKILEREPDLESQFLAIIPQLNIPKIDGLAVTRGPGLEPALWVGINFAKALAQVWNKPLYPINHLEGHILSILNTTKQATKNKIDKIEFPVISLIVSGGHTELILSKNWLKYKIIGQTRDDAVGEAFDKVARILGLNYPGGPEIAKLALSAKNLKPETLNLTPINLPRPMIHSGNFDFSFSGLKTAVLYLTQNLQTEQKFNQDIKAIIADDFQQAVIEVLTTKTLLACQKFKAKTIIIGGGVIANAALRQALDELADRHNLTLFLPDLSLSTDNATMIALTAGLRLLAGRQKNARIIKADGNLKLA